LGLVAWAGAVPLSGLACLAVLALSVGGLMGGLAAQDERRIVVGLFCVALLIFTGEALFVQTTPQWLNDGAFDTARYDLNARALVMHWQGLPVPSAEFKLLGFERRLRIAVWSADDPHAYNQVLGMSRYLYQLYVAGIYFLTDGSRATAVLSNLPFAAGTVTGAYLLARALFDQQRVALLAATLLILDPGLAVWSAILMRDVMLAWLMVLALLGCVRLLRRQGHIWMNALLAGGALALLSLIRFNAVAALLLAGGVTGWLSWSMTRWKRALYTVIALGLALLALFQTIPDEDERWTNHLFSHVVAENLEIFNQWRRVADAALGLADNEAQGKMDGVRREWHANLRSQPLWVNLARATARSVLSPFPWVAFTHGLSGTNYYELLFPGMTLWLLCLPAFFYALWRVPVRDDPAALLCLVWLGAVTVFYMIGYGQLDGRNRLMAQPLLWSFTAQGIVWLATRWPNPINRNRRVG
jgi:4-amino-4-deoxy-L-arabinose transferase-like glycosyltransferase